MLVSHITASGDTIPMPPSQRAAKSAIANHFAQAFEKAREKIEGLDATPKSALDMIRTATDHVRYMVGEKIDQLDALRNELRVVQLEIDGIKKEAMGRKHTDAERTALDELGRQEQELKAQIAALEEEIKQMIELMQRKARSNVAIEGGFAIAQILTAQATETSNPTRERPVD